MTERRWIVRAGEGRTVGDIVRRIAPEDARAVDEGRVFVGRKRVRRADAEVSAGDEVVVSLPAAAAAPVVILAKGEGWFAVDKPAGLPTIPDQAGASHSLVARAARALGVDAARLHATSRLDRDVSGVVVFAQGTRAAEQLRAMRDEHRYARRYVAIAARAPSPAEGTWNAPVGRATNPKLRAANGADAAASTTHYAVVGEAPPYVLLAVSPVTGRTHQIRVHASHAGAPLVGDRAYGGPTRATLPNGRVVAFDRIALHAARVTLAGEAIVSPIPPALAATWLALGGDAASWDQALACSLADR